MKKWGSLNWLTPRRRQLSQASSGDGGGWGSRSRTVTWWPSSASNRAVPKPTTPAPRITMSAMVAGAGSMSMAVTEPRWPDALGEQLDGPRRAAAEVERPAPRGEVDAAEQGQRM